MASRGDEWLWGGRSPRPGGGRLPCMKRRRTLGAGQMGRGCAIADSPTGQVTILDPTPGIGTPPFKLLSSEKIHQFQPITPPP